MTEYVLGVNILQKGCRVIALKPHLGNLQYARGSIATPKGRVEIVHTKAEDGKIITQVSAPKGIKVY